jgi:glycosyltransferase involved in cell wall biosynthesis
VVAFIGRVVSIKDVKTFIRGVFTASRRMPALEGWIIGPDTEDLVYARECRDLVASLGLQDRIKFLGLQRIEDFLPRIGLVALSSISEGLPLVILEAFAAGVPVVTTDVGACRTLIEGWGDEDRALGSAGALVPIANPERFAQAVTDLLGHPAAWRAAQAAGIARVERYYTDVQMQASYQCLYEKLMDKAVCMAGEQ